MKVNIASPHCVVDGRSLLRVHSPLFEGSLPSFIELEWKTVTAIAKRRDFLCNGSILTKHHIYRITKMNFINVFSLFFLS